MSPRPDCVKNLSEVTAEPYDRKGISGVSRDLWEALGSKLIGIDVTEIAPCSKSSYFHCHDQKEEFFYVLSGRCSLRLGEETHELAVGDAVSRPAGTGICHKFINTFNEPCSILMLGVMAGEGLTDVVHWPELKRLVVFDAEGKVTLKRS